MNPICEKANLDLAALLGWTGVFSGGGSLVGTPPNGAPACRGQAMVPDWCGSWDACGPLMVEYGTFPRIMISEGILAMQSDGYLLGSLVVADFPSVDHAVRTAIVYSVTHRIGNRNVFGSIAA